MAEVTIKAYSRRGKNGKTIQVRSYTRRVGRKGIRSPKREKTKPGEEIEKRVEEVAPVKPTITKEELERRRQWEETFKKAEVNRKKLGMSREQYSHYLLNNKGNKEGKTPQKPAIASPRQPMSKKSKSIFDKIEDKIAKFVEKYGNKKYRR